MASSNGAATRKEGAGILIRTLKRGNGHKAPKSGDSCLIHYECTLENGMRVDSTRDRNQPLQFQVGAKQVIYGLDVAVQNMTLGQDVEVTIPYLYAYGQRGHPPKIPPQSTLIFRLELLEIEDQEKPHTGFGGGVIRRTLLKHRAAAPPNLL